MSYKGHAGFFRLLRLLLLVLPDDHRSMLLAPCCEEVTVQVSARIHVRTPAAASTVEWALHGNMEEVPPSTLMAILLAAANPIEALDHLASARLEQAQMIAESSPLRLIA